MNSNSVNSERQRTRAALERLIQIGAQSRDPWKREQAMERAYDWGFEDLGDRIQAREKAFERETRDYWRESGASIYTAPLGW